MLNKKINPANDEFQRSKVFAIITLSLPLKECGERAKQHVVQHGLSDTCQGSLYLRMKDTDRQHCKFERSPVQEILSYL
jgi:hypothetical protein